MAIPWEAFINVSLHSFYMTHNSKFNLTPYDWAYLAGFLDGDGSLLAQIVKNPNYKYGFTIRVSINFYQKKSRHWFLLKFHKKFKQLGHLRIRNDGMSELTFVRKDVVRHILTNILPFSMLKIPLIKLLINILDQKEKINTKCDFLKVCILVDKVAELTDSKKRVYTSFKVREHFLAP